MIINSLQCDFKIWIRSSKYEKDGEIVTILVKDATIVTMNRDKPLIKHGYAFVKDGQFEQVTEGDPSAEWLSKAERVISAKGKWMLPGLVNTHGHTGMALLRGHSDDLPLHRWLEEKMWPFEAKQDQKAVKAGRALALVEMIQSGTTTFLEMYHLFMDDFAEMIEKVGMRATLMRSMIGLCSKEEQETKLKEAVSFAKTWHKQANGRIQTMLAPHAPYTCPPPFISRIVEEAKQLDLPVHMHLAETKKEVDDHRQQYGFHPLEHLEQINVLSAVPWLFAHGVHMPKREIERLSLYDTAISYNPKSNLKLGSGIAPIHDMHEKGITIGFGTDSVASNNTLDLFEEMRLGNLVQKGINQDSTLMPAALTLEFATINGAKALRFADIGEINIGQQADFILLDADKAHLQPDIHVQSHLVYAAKGSDVTDVYVQGKPLMEQSTLLTLDEEKIRFEAKEQYQRICKLT